MEGTPMQALGSTQTTLSSQEVSNGMPVGESISAPTPTKRGPGRPKGSGKKVVDPNTPVLPKRPVGRPRKDGLPAGSVPRAAPSGVRKRRVAAPGGFAAASSSAPPSVVTTSASAPQYSSPPNQYGAFAYTPAQPPAQPSWQTTTYSTLSAALQPGPPRESASAPSTHAVHAPVIAPHLAQDDWANLLRTDPNALVQSLLTALQAPNPITRAGQTVEDAFKAHMPFLPPHTSAQAPPNVYLSLKTFWLPSSPPYFGLTVAAPVPAHRFFYWDPQSIIFNGIGCPYCAQPLANRGCIRSGPLKVYDVGSPFYIIGCEYICQSQACKNNGFPDGRKFSSTDPDIIRALPVVLRDELPAHLILGAAHNAYLWNWQGAGVSKTLWTIVQSCLLQGIGKDAIVHIIRSTEEGLPGPAPHKQDDEGEEQDEENQDEERQEMEVDQAVQEPKEAPPTSYADPWKAHNVISTPPAPSSSDTVPASVPPPIPIPVQAPPGAIPAPYGYPQGAPGPYMAYPYGDRAFQQYSYHHHDPNAPGGKAGSAEPPAAKRVRHCVKCGSKDCKGKGGRNFCTNACQDCGKSDCKGRNSKRPDKTCTDAWA
ncbi:hypothetical protein OF83DRAFT_1080143 [Amylostereum chailletii]|nr:hypothetical protein OF83DRAFT_1080143 [Amylostereum chailletii]